MSERVSISAVPALSETTRARSSRQISQAATKSPIFPAGPSPREVDMASGDRRIAPVAEGSSLAAARQRPSPLGLQQDRHAPEPQHRLAKTPRDLTRPVHRQSPMHRRTHRDSPMRRYVVALNGWVPTRYLCLPDCRQTRRSQSGIPVDVDTPTSLHTANIGRARPMTNRM